jgi:manganese-dependent inorganic pyrophosphatase
MPQTYVIGHLSPDLDSVAAAIAYARFLNKKFSTDEYVPAVAGAVNRETAYALEKFGFPVPETVRDGNGKRFVLVDHNEAAQSVARDGATITGILDHHKFDFKSADPIHITVRPWGSSCTIITNKFLRAGMPIEAGLAGLMLSAVLVDTVITKSPTTTAIDRDAIAKLSETAGIADWQAFGMELFKIRSSVKELSAAAIVKSDFKDFAFKAGTVGIGQVETVDLDEFSDREDELLTELNRLRDEGGYHTTVLFLTDIIKEGSLFLVATGDQALVERALEAKLDANRVYIEGILSRKKQVAPKFTAVFDA